LKSGVEKRHAGALVLRFVVACSSGRGAVSVEGAGDVDEAGGIVGDALALAAGDGIGVEGVGDVDKADVVVEVVVAVASVGIGGVEGARAFAGDGAVCDVDEAGIVVVRVAFAVAFGGCAGAVVAETRILWGVSDLGGDGIGAVEVEGV